MRLEELMLLRFGSSDLAIRVSEKSFGTPLPAMLRNLEYVNPIELEINACIDHLLGRKTHELLPPLRVQFMLDFIKNKIDILSTEALLQVPQVGEEHGEEEEE